MGNDTPSVGGPRGPRLIKTLSRNVPNVVSPVFLGAHGFGSADLTVEARPSPRFARNDKFQISNFAIWNPEGHAHGLTSRSPRSTGLPQRPYRGLLR